MVEWLKRGACDQHGLGSKRAHAILLHPCKRHVTALFAAWQSWQAVPNFTHISIKLKNQNKKFHANSDILASSEAGRGNCLSYV